RWTGEDQPPVISKDTVVLRRIERSNAAGGMEGGQMQLAQLARNEVSHHRLVGKQRKDIAAVKQFPGARGAKPDEFVKREFCICGDRRSQKQGPLTFFQA